MTTAVILLPEPIPSQTDFVDFAVRGNEVLAGIPATVVSMNAQNVENNALHELVSETHKKNFGCDCRS